MSHPAPRPTSHEITMIVKLSPGTLADTIRQLVQTMNSVPVTLLEEEPTPAPSDPAPRPESTADPPPPATTGPAVQVVAPDPGSSPGQAQGGLVVPAGLVLGPLCKRGHRHDGLPLSLRSQHTGKCVACCRMSPEEKAQYRPPRRLPVRNGPPGAARPELPAHLALTGFLSPITCRDPTHRYRELEQWTLRFSADERCVMCVTQASQLALAGD